MKTTLCAIFVLTAILALGIWFEFTISDICTSYEAALEEVNAEHMEESRTILDEMTQDWEVRKSFLAAFTHHSLLDTIQNALSRTRAAAAQNDTSLFVTEMGTLKEAIKALSDSGKPSLGNIF